MRNSNNVEGITVGSFHRSYQNKNGLQLKVTIKGVQYGKIDNNVILLDKVKVERFSDLLVEALYSNSTKYFPQPQEICVELNPINPTQSSEEKTSDDIDDITIIRTPLWKLEDIYLEPNASLHLMTALTICKSHQRLFHEWGLLSTFRQERATILNFFGPPGTGKSMLAEGIASFLEKPILQVNYSQLESKYVGETPKNIRKCFQMAKEKDAVLVFDEADSFLSKRLTSVTHSADYGVNITRSVMLLELEQFRGIVVFTTNLIKNYDDAFKRRILASIELDLPDENGRECIWDKHIPKSFPLSDGITTEELARRYSGVSGADIKDIILYAAVLCIQRDGRKVDWEDFDKAYKFVMSRYEGSQNLISVSTETITEKQYNLEIKELNNHGNLGEEQ